MSFQSSPSDDPCFKKKINSKKRDFLVKNLKKDREAAHFERQQQYQREQEEDEEEHVAPERAGRIVVVKNSYLTQSLSEMNKQNDNLPKKWRKNDHVSESENEEDEDDELDEEDEEDLDEDEEAEEAETLKNTEQNRLLAEYDDDEDEVDHRNTQTRIVRIIEDFNEVEFVESDANTKHSHAYKEGNTVAPQSMRDRSKSPRLAAQTTPKLGPSDEQLPAISVGTPKFGATKQKELTQLTQQLEDLDLGEVLKNKRDPSHKLTPLPHEDELDTGVWWTYILDHGASIKSNGTLDIEVVKWFVPAATHDIPESYFHLPTGRRSPPEKALTAFGLFKKHYLEGSIDTEDVDGEGEKEGDGDANQPGKKKAKAKKQSRTKKANNSKGKKGKAPSDAHLKTLFFDLGDEIVEYYILALIEKIRYKCQRVEYIYQQSTKINAKGGKK